MVSVPNELRGWQPLWVAISVLYFPAVALVAIDGMPPSKERTISLWKREVEEAILGASVKPSGIPDSLTFILQLNTNQSEASTDETMLRRWRRIFSEGYLDDPSVKVNDEWEPVKEVVGKWVPDGPSVLSVTLPDGTTHEVDPKTRRLSKVQTERYARAIETVDARYRPLVDSHGRRVAAHFALAFGVFWLAPVVTLYALGRMVGWVVSGFRRQRPTQARDG